MRNLILSGALVVAFATQVEAGNIDSAYTKIQVENCPVIMQDRESGSVAWMCEGYRGMELYVAEGDLRYFVSAGPGAAQRTAASQTLGPFNRIHTTLEWRLERGSGGNWYPFATILRYFVDIDGQGREEQILVVSKLGPDDSCQIAHVNASRNQNANVLARQAADQLARNFVCGSDRIATIGSR